jgi:hypothetical protein
MWDGERGPWEVVIFTWRDTPISVLSAAATIPEPFVGLSCGKLGNGLNDEAVGDNVLAVHFAGVTKGSLFMSWLPFRRTRSLCKEFSDRDRTIWAWAIESGFKSSLGDGSVKRVSGEPLRESPSPVDE